MCSEIISDNLCIRFCSRYRFPVDATICISCERLLSAEWALCPYCGHVIDKSNPNLEYKQPMTPTPRMGRRSFEQWIDDNSGLGAILVLAVLGVGIFLVASLWTHFDSTINPRISSQVTASPSPVASPSASYWHPSGYFFFPEASISVAFKNVPQGQTSPCTWCSRSHGTSFWELDVQSLSACNNFYLNAAIYSQSGSLEKYWYQKLQNTPSAPQPFRIEIVTSDPTSTYRVVKVTCS